MANKNRLDKKTERYSSTMRIQKLLSVLDGSAQTSRYIKHHLSHHDCECTLIDAGAAGGNHHRWGNGLDVLNKKQFDPSFESKLESKSLEQIPFALAGKNGHITIRINSKQETSSIYPPNIDFLDLFDASERFTMVKQVSVPSVTLESHIGSDYWFGKFDVQGMELEVVESAGNSLKNCIGLEIEVEFSEIYLGQPLTEDVYKYLRNHGFEFIDFLAMYRWKKPGQKGPGQLVFTDALFMRTPEAVADNLGDCAAKLYLAVCLNYGRLDLIERLIGRKAGLHNAKLKRLLAAQSRRLSIQKTVATVVQLAMRPILRGTTLYVIR